MMQNCEEYVHGQRGTAPIRLILLGIVILLGFGCTADTGTPKPWPKRVLVTNDNGIDDIGMIELARAFARDGLEVVVVVAQEDRSGASNYMSATRTGRFLIERRDLGTGIEAYALDGHPADCVVFALTGPMQGTPPDLVVSGINGGANLADDWFGSGTIGAARTAAYLGFPAVAVSGLEDDDPSAVVAATGWVVEFVRSDVVRALEPPQYLTVSLPVGSPSEVRGVRLVERARGLMGGQMNLVESSEEGKELWALELQVDPSRAAPDTDVRAVAEGYIAIVPMSVDESDAALKKKLSPAWASLPEWPEVPMQAAAAEPFPCDRSLGISIDDAEDASGREWGVLVEEVAVGSRGERVGLRPGDVITALNGTQLASNPSIDPDDRFVQLYRPLPCGETVQFEVVREEETFTIEFQMGG